MRVFAGAMGGGGPFNVMDLTKGNLLNGHCLELMRDAPTGSPWFEPPPIFTKQGNAPWHDPAKPGNPRTSKKLAREILDRVLAVVFARTFFVADRGICGLADLNWLTGTNISTMYIKNNSLSEIRKYTIQAEQQAALYRTARCFMDAIGRAED